MHAILTTYKNRTLRMITSNRSRPLIAYFALGAVCIIWGTTYLALRIGVTQFPPFLFSVMRFLCAGPILLGFILTLGKASLPGRKSLFNQAIAGLFMVPLSLIFDDYSTIHWSGGVTSALVYLILVGSVAGYACFSYAVKKLPMTIVSLYAYINPIVAVLLGWLVLDEKLNLRIGIAILITIAGVYIVNKGYQLKDVWRAQFSK